MFVVKAKNESDKLLNAIFVFAFKTSINDDVGIPLREITAG